MFFFVNNASLICEQIVVKMLTHSVKVLVNLDFAARKAMGFKASCDLLHFSSGKDEKYPLLTF